MVYFPCGICFSVKNTPRRIAKLTKNRRQWNRIPLNERFSSCPDAGGLDPTVDGWNPAPPRMMIIPLFIKVLTIPNGAGFQPSTVLVMMLMIFSISCDHYNKPTLVLYQWRLPILASLSFTTWEMIQCDEHSFQKRCYKTTNYLSYQLFIRYNHLENWHVPKKGTISKLARGFNSYLFLPPRGEIIKTWPASVSNGLVQPPTKKMLYNTLKDPGMS